jgi:hypothetical protein
MAGDSSRALICACALAGVVVSHSAFAILLETYPATLSASDRKQIEQVACTRPHGVSLQSLEAERYEKAPNATIYVALRCKSHGTLHSRVVNFRTACENSHGRWECESPILEIHFAVRGQDTAVSSGDLPDKLAVDMAMAVAASGTFQNESLADAVRSGCSLGHGLVQNDADLFSMSCSDGLTLEVVRERAGARETFRVVNASRAIP